MSNKFPFVLPPEPTDKKRIVFSFGESDIEFFKCFPSDDYLGTQYDKNPAQLLIVWDIFLRPYNCEMQIYNPKMQLLVSVPVPKNINVPYTVLDGMINEWVTKEEFVFFQFVFTKNGEFVKSTVPVRLNLSKAAKPNFQRSVKPIEFDRMKLVYDTAVVSAALRFDNENGWVYDFYTHDGTLAFSLAWVPHDVVRCTEQVLSPNEKMIARANLKIPSTFVLDVTEEDGVQVVKDLSEYVNDLSDVSFEVWKDNGDGSFSEVSVSGKSYDKTKIRFTLDEPILGTVRVQCKSARFVPSDDSVLIGSIFSGNGLMNENDERLFTNQEMKE